MSTEFFRKYINIINEAQDFPSQAKALRQRRIAAVREWVYLEIEEIYKEASKGLDMTDNIADELGDHYEQVQRSGDPVLQRAYEMVRMLSDSTPEEQAAGAATAMKMLKGQISEDLSKKAIKLIQDYRALYPTIAYDSNGEMTMEPEEAHDETCDQLGVDPEVMDRYFELEDDTVAEGNINEESELAALAKQHGMEHRQQTYGAELTHPNKGSINVNRYGEWNHYPARSKNSAAHGGYKELADYLKKMSGH
jgi:hypothetical protein